RGGSFEVVQDLRQVTIAISHRSRPAGDTFSVPIKLLEDITGLEVWAIEFTLLFDTLLTATIVSDRGTVADLWRETPNAFYSFQTGIFKDRVMVAIAASFSLWGDGTFANITFEVSPDAQSGTTSPLHFENFRVNEGEPPAEFIDGWFSVASVPDIDFSLRAHDFDSVAVGESESWQLTVYNVGTEDLVVDSIVSTLSDFTFSEETLPRTVSSDGHFDVVVYFSPSRLGEIAGLMRFVSNDPDEATAIISLKGIGAHEVGVELASFAGLWTGREVLLQWSVGAMADLLGFQVYRRGEGETEYRRLTPHPLMGADKFIFRDEEVPGPGSYFYRLGAVETNGQEEFVGTVTVKVPDPDLSFSLSQNYPNPFNPTTTLCYTIPSREQGAESEGRGEDSELYALRATLKIFNLLGQEVRTLVDEVKEAGHYTVTWDGRDYQGDEVPSGVYFYRLEADGFSETRSMLLLR
ncbi:MAG: choice-of-anchor D domain-containing protein, partial [bacterium]